MSLPVAEDVQQPIAVQFSTVQRLMVIVESCNKL